VNLSDDDTQERVRRALFELADAMSVTDTTLSARGRIRPSRGPVVGSRGIVRGALVAASLALVVAGLAWLASTRERDDGPSDQPHDSVSTTTTDPRRVVPGEPWLAFDSFVPGKAGKSLFLVRPDGSGAHLIAGDVPGEHLAASWSPDGSRIAFVVKDTATPNGSIWTANADGSGATRLSDGGGKCGEGLFHPNWFPDGKRLTAVCFEAGGQNADIAIVDASTGVVTPIHTLTWPEFTDGQPTVSPDGASIAFDILHWDPTNTFLDGSLIAVMSVSGQNVRRLTTFDTFMAHPDWSPDGNELVMNSYDLGNIQATEHSSNIYAMKPDGTGLRQITRSSVDGNMRICEPRWSPDGTRIVVTVATSNRTDHRITSISPAFVDPKSGELTLVSPSLQGGAPDLRPAP
jgi:Tol biopolymer transport system component